MSHTGNLQHAFASWGRRLRHFVASPKFFWLIIVLFVLQASWIALSARYPGAFDEQSHFGLIQLHAQQLTPFFTHQPTAAADYGAVVRDPSYLYHYLMSFPYRVITHFTHDVTIQVILLRFINIALLATALIVFRRVLQYARSSDTVVHLVLLALVLTPVVPLLGAQINYDNLVVLLSAWLVLLCLRLQKQVAANQKIHWGLLAGIALICMLGSLVKYAFLPLALAAVIYVVRILWRRQARLDLRRASAWKLAATLVLLLLSFGLFAERYGVNIVRYHTPTPECDQVLSVAQCQTYSPWLRNYQLASQTEKPVTTQIISYPVQWVTRTVEESLFAIGSGFNNGINIAQNNFGTVDYWQARSLPIPRLMTYATLFVSLVSVVVVFRKLRDQPVLRLMSFFIGLYVLILFLQNFSDFMHIGSITAVHGRYLMPILPLLYLLMAVAVQTFLHLPQIAKRISITAQTWVLTLGILVFVSQGGGIVTYIVRSQSRWFWPQNTSIQNVNSGVQRVLWHHALGSDRN